MELKIEYVPVDELIPSATNSKLHPHDQVDQIAESIDRFGNCDPIGVWTDSDGETIIVEGHGRVMALKKLGWENAPVIYLDHLSDAERRQYSILHNQLTMSSDFDFAVLEKEIESMPDFDWDSFGIELDGFGEMERELDAAEEGNVPQEVEHRTLKEQFGFVPFSVIQTTATDWMERKRKWLDMGIRSEEGRGGGLAFNCRMSLAASLV